MRIAILQIMDNEMPLTPPHTDDEIVYDYAWIPKNATLVRMNGRTVFQSTPAMYFLHLAITISLAIGLGVLLMTRWVNSADNLQRELQMQEMRRNMDTAKEWNAAAERRAGQCQILLEEAKREIKR